MNPNEKAKNYLLDLGMLLREKALEAKESKKESGSEYDLGRLMAYHEVVSLMRQQAEAFGIEFSELNLEGLDPEQDLL